MKIRLEGGLPYVTASIWYRGSQLAVENVLLDTGSVGTVFSADRVADIDLVLEADDAIHRIRGVGGAEFVFSKRVERLVLGELRDERRNRQDWENTQEQRCANSDHRAGCSI